MRTSIWTATRSVSTPAMSHARGARSSLEAATEVGPSLFFSLLIITVSFLPVFVLGGESGRLFRPLALTKTFSMAAAALLSVTIIPVLMVYFITARVLPKEWGWKTNLLITMAAMVFPAGLALVCPRVAPRDRAIPLVDGHRVGGAGRHAAGAPADYPRGEKSDQPRPPAALRAVLPRGDSLPLAGSDSCGFVCRVGVWPFRQLGSEFMPPLDEGDLLYMPTTDPSISITKARQVLQQTDKLIKTFPEVISVYGKDGPGRHRHRSGAAGHGRNASCDSTPIRSMADAQAAYWFDSLPPLAHLATAPHLLAASSASVTMKELVNGWDDADGHHGGLDSVVRLPGLGNLWPMPIDNRLKMLSTGVKSPVGLKIMGPDLKTLPDLAEKAAAHVEAGAGHVDAYPERAVRRLLPRHRHQTDVIRRRYGLTIGDVQDVITTAIGGMKISTAVEGLERFPINLRYARDLREDPSTLEAGAGAHSHRGANSTGRTCDRSKSIPARR